jgi:tetratricopeptide (TPR) repeat protein
MPASATDPAFRILLVVSRPLDQPDLPYIGDQWALINGLRSVNAPVHLKILRPPTIECLRTEILAGYEILHFDGHGSFGLRCPNCSMLHDNTKKKCNRCSSSLEDQEENGYLAFERQDGVLDSLSAQDLAEIVAFTGSPMKLLILSACKSAAGDENGIMQTLIDKDVPAVIGMSETISPEATEALFSPFYAALGAGLTLSDALKTARRSLRRFEDSGKATFSIPRLEGKGKDAKIVETRCTGNAAYEPNLLYGVPQYKFVGDCIRGNPPRGRKGYVSRLIQAFLDNEKLVVLTGQGGIGKTVLAAETSRRLAWRFPGGVFWRSADMQQFGLSDLLDAFVDVFGEGFRQQTNDAKRDQVLGYLGRMDKGSLIVVDNAERIKDEHLWRFLEGIPQPSAALVTTRDSLAYGGQEIHIDEMEEGESIRLFTSEASGKSPRWGRVLKGKEKLSSQEQKELVEIWRLLQGHPLGLKVAAGMLSSHSLPFIHDSLRAHPPNEVSKRFDFSYELLPESETELLQRITVFAGSFSLEAVQAVCATEGQSLDCSESLGDLVRKSFVEKTDDAVSRYRLHFLMRQYASGKARPERVADYRRKAALFFLDIALRFKSDFGTLELEKENILAGMDWAVEQMRSSTNAKDAAEMLSYFMISLDDYSNVRGYWDADRIRLIQAIEAAVLLENEVYQAGWTHNLGFLEQKTGNIDQSRKLYLQSLEMFQKLGDQNGISRSLHHLGMLDQDTGNYDGASRYYQQSLEIFQKLGDQSGISRSLHQLGVMAQGIGDYEGARKLYQQSLEIKREMSDQNGISSSLHQMGMMAQDIGDYEGARKFYRQSLEIAEELGDLSSISISHHQLGNLAYLKGNYDEALKLYQQSLETKAELGDKKGISRSLHQLGIMAEEIGDYDEARKLHRQSMEIKKKLGDQSGISSSLHQLGIIAEEIGDYDEARKLHQKSLEIKKELGDQSGISSSLHQLGIIAYLKGNYDKARKLYQQSLEIKKELGDKSGYAISLAQLALLKEDTGDIPKAIELTQQAESIFADLGAPHHVEKARKQRERLEGKNSSSE